MSAVRKSDVSAFATLFARYAPILRRHFRRQGDTAAEAEDLAQDVFRVVWEKGNLFDPAKATAETWIFTIARNRRIDRFRKRKLMAESERDAAYRSEEINVVQPRDLDIDRLRSVIERLPSAQADVIVASYFLRKPHREIACDLGVPVGTVKSRIRLAMQRLRSELKAVD